MSDLQVVHDTLITAYRNSNNSWLTVYAVYSNQLKIVSDTDDWERIEFLAQVVGELEQIITIETMKNAGWYIDESETFPKWKLLS